MSLNLVKEYYLIILSLHLVKKEYYLNISKPNYIFYCKVIDTLFTHNIYMPLLGKINIKERAISTKIAVT